MQLLKKVIDKDIPHEYNEIVANRTTGDGVWLSLARAPGLGPGGRRFESCHPD